MAAGDVWDYIFGSYVNAARAPPYINDGVIVIRRLNARGAPATKAAAQHSDSVPTPRERERADRCTHSVLRTVTHCEIRPTVTASRTRSIKSDDAARRDAMRWDAMGQDALVGTRTSNVRRFNVASDALDETRLRTITGRDS